MVEYLYHASPSSNREAIRRDGLRAPLGRISFRLQGGINVTHVQPGYRHPIHAATCDLREFIQDLHVFLENEQVDLWRIDVTGLALHAGWDGEGTFALDWPIPSERLELVEDAVVPELPPPVRAAYPEWATD